MVEEILGLGVKSVELGYDLTADLVPGVMHMVEQGAVKVASVHNFCPVPVGAPYGHPELFQLTSTDKSARESAVRHTTRTIEFAAELGAGVVVVHAGNVDMKRFTPRLISLIMQGKLYGRQFEKTKIKLLIQRDKKVRKHLDHLYAALEELLPKLEQCNVQLALENLPSWESIPTESEMEQIGRHFDSPLIRYWHDIGHGQIRQNLGLTTHIRWLEKLSSMLAGMHIHDVIPPDVDHLMPPDGSVHFDAFTTFAALSVPLVFEPAPGMPAPQLKEGIQIVREAWDVTRDTDHEVNP